MCWIAFGSIAILSVGRSLSHRTGLVIVGESHSSYHFFVAIVPGRLLSHSDVVMQYQEM